MVYDPVLSTDRLRSVLAGDLDGSWTAVFAAQLEALSKYAAASAATLVADDLSLRCKSLASGALLGAKVLPVLRRRLVADLAHRTLPAASASLLARTTPTSMLYEIGWLAIEAGMESDGLFIVESIGTLLHGRLGGSIFRVESLLAMGNSVEAARELENRLARDADPDGLAAATLAALWQQRAEGRRGSTAGPNDEESTES